MSNSSTNLREAFSPPNQVADAANGRQEVQPRLLIVDDISDNRTVLKRRFERRGFDVSEAESGLIAIDLIERSQFDLVLLDVMMPGIDGMETLKRIRSRKSASALPVIMVTAKSESDNIVDALELGANDYVTKPVDFAVALARVNTQLSRRRAEQQVALANEELRKANEDLERRVEERTHRLIDANQRLKEEIADREELQARSQYLAYHDSLTGLGNRLLFKEQLDEALRDVSVTPHPLAVLFLDLDGFKAVNDTLGHSVGDLLLKSIAVKLRDLLPSTDRIARLGWRRVCHPCRCRARNPHLPRRSLSGSSRSSPSHTISTATMSPSAPASALRSRRPGEMSTENLLKSADLAMYSAKSEGRGTYRIFDPRNGCDRSGAPLARARHADRARVGRVRGSSISH